MDCIVGIKNVFADLFIDLLFINGVRRKLEDKDLCRVKESYKGEKVCNKMTRDWRCISKHLNNRPGISNTVLVLKWILIKSVSINFFLTGIFIFLEHSLNLTKDLLLAALVGSSGNSTANNPTNITQQNSDPDSGSNAVIMTACVLIAAALGEIITSTLKSYFDAFNSTHLRVLFETIIYSKLLRVKQSALKDFNVIHLISSDTQIFREGIATIHILWIAPIELAAVIFFMWTRLGLEYSVIPGVVFLTIVSIIQLLLSNKFQSFRNKMLQYADRRLDCVQNLIANISIVRLLAWEEPISKIMYQAKNTEDNFLKKQSLIRFLKIIFFLICPTVTTYLTGLTYSLALGKQISAGQVNAGFLIFAQLSGTLVFEFNHAIYLIKEINLSLKRIARLLDLPEYECVTDASLKKPNADTPERVKDVTQNGSVLNHEMVQLQSTEQENKTYLKISSTNNSQISLIAYPETGKNIVGISGNITAGNSELLLSIIGEFDTPEDLKIEKKGSLVFVPKEAWLFDGNIKENIIFCEEVDEDWYQEVINICGVEEESRCLGIEDETQVMDEASIKGPMAMKICIARAIYKKADIYLFDDIFSSIDLKSSITIFRNLIDKLMSDKIVLIATNQVEILNLVTREIKMKNGEIKDIFSRLRLSITEDQDSGSKQSHNDHRLSAKRGSKMLRQKSRGILQSQDSGDWRQTYNVKEDEMIHHISFRTYINYMLSGSNIAIIYALLILAILAETANILSLVGWFFLPPSSELTIVLNTSNNSYNSTFPVEEKWKTYITVSVFTALSVLCYLSFCVVTMFVLLQCSDALHDKMYSSILKAKNSFFIRTPVDIIVNRFIRDITVCDDILPCHFTFFTVLTAQSVGVIALTFSINQSILIPALLTIVVILIIFRWIYLKTSRSVRSLESKLCIPLYSHSNITLNGILTIHSHNCQKNLMSHFLQCQDNYSNAYYTYHLVNIWVGIRVGIIGIFTLSLVTAVILTAITAADYIVATTLGQIILALWMLRHWMLLSIEVENEMISVQRLFSYQNLPSQPNYEGEIKVCENWPVNPTIEFEDVTFCFAPYLPNMLQQISFTIKSGETIGIVGKNASATLAAMACLNEFSGRIKIDDVDITTVHPSVLRDSIAIIPIDCLVLPGTLRLNLDPFDKASDKEIWEILEMTELKDLVNTLPNQLSFDMSQFNQSFSQGQRKLFSLARALLKKSNLLIMDSAVNSLDQETESKVHKIIRTHCRGKTVIYLTDRLIQLSSCERLIILEGPRLVENDTLSNLIKNGNSEVCQILNSTYTQEVKQFTSEANTNNRRNSFSKSSKKNAGFSLVNVEI